MTGYIFGAVLYLVVGYILSLVIGFRVRAGEGGHILLCMLMWPVVILFVAAWVIEDVLMYLHRKKR